MDGGADTADGGGGVAIGADGEVHRAEWHLGGGDVHGGATLGFELGIAHVADDADDHGGFGIGAAADLDALDQRVLIGVELAREGFADEHYLGRGGVVARREVAARFDGDAQRAEIARRGGIEGGRRLIADWDGRLADLHEGQDVIVAGEWKDLGGAGDGDAGQGANAIEGASVEGLLLRVGLVFGAGEIGVKGEDVVRVEAGVDALQVVEAAHQESGAAEEDEGERDLADHQHAAHRIAPEADRVAAAAFAECRREIGLRHVDRRRESEENPGEHGDGDGESDHAGVERNLSGARQDRGVEVDEQARAGPCEQEPEGGAERGEQDAFGEELADEAPASRAERVADADFAAARGGAGEQEIRKVHTGDEENEADGGHQGEHQGTDLADHGFL